MAAKPEIHKDVAERLKRVAARSPNHNQHACALVARNGNVIVATHNVWDEHAEERAVRRYLALDHLRQQRVAYALVVRITKSGKGFAASAPCLKCTRVLAPMSIPVFHT